MFKDLLDNDENESAANTEKLPEEFAAAPETLPEESPAVIGNAAANAEPEMFPLAAGRSESTAPPPLPYTPDTFGESVRKSGLAWSASIALFGSVVFMLVIGWFADLLLGSSPWGIVAGIVLGSVIGFIQFFRISAQIFKPSRPQEAIDPLHMDEGRKD
jgi:F0F1-type ATP synthase assembly protein I